ncbi:MAG TPA: PIG-L family deacetylase [Gemmatimonadaceae bacterium]|nr:PIG-L family deacetylase [Gemmatimonadaceae bacterium]
MSNSTPQLVANRAPFPYFSPMHILRLTLAACVAVTAFALPVSAQQTTTNPPPDERFKVDILVISPHPDDETTIAGYLAKAVLDEHRRVAVLSTTRGDAGSNLVGFESAKALGEIREIETRHALASIGIDKVFFLRMPDTPGQDVSDVLRSLETGNHGQALADAVRFIRLTRPEVVITMLPATVSGENHEDHQASGVIATEAFDLAGDPTAFPEQVAMPEDRLWYGNLMEGLRPWQPKKLYYYTDATHFEFMKGKGPEYSMTEISRTRGESYARLAAKEQTFHRTQYGDQPDRALATNNLRDFDQPLPFVLAKSLVGGSVTADIMDGVGARPIPFSPVRGYRPETLPPLSIELGQGWSFYKRFYPAHNLEVMNNLLPPELGVGSGQHFPVILLLRNGTDRPVTFHLHTQLPPGWAIDSTTPVHGHPWPQTTFVAGSHDDLPARIRLVAPMLAKPEWQTVTWTADADGTQLGPISLRVHVGAQ